MYYQKILFITVFLTNLLALFPQLIHAEERHKAEPNKIEIEDKSQVPNRDYSAKNLNELIEELTTYNPELRALVEQIKASELKIPQAGSLEDPRLSFEASNIPIREPALNRTAMTGLQIYLRQSVPFPGKLKLKKQMASSQSEQEKQAYYERFNQLIDKFKQSYFEYIYLEQAIDLNQQTQSKLQALIQFLNARYSTGQAMQQDILKTKLEVSNIKNRLIQLQAQKKILATRLNTLLYRPANTALKLKVPANPKITAFKTSPALLVELAKNNRPWLKKKTAQIKEAKLGYQLAKKSLLPDFDFGVGYRVRQGASGDPVMSEDFFSAGVSINLPIYAAIKQNKRVQEMVHRQKEEKYLQEATLQEVIYETEKAYYDAMKLKSQINLLNTRTIPQDRATIESSRASYEANEVEFLNVLLSEISLLNHRIDQAHYYSQYQQKIAEIEMAVGMPMEAIEAATVSQEEFDEK